MPGYYCNLESPWGSLLLLADGEYLTGLYFADENHCPSIGPDWIKTASVFPFKITIEQLNRYFEGSLKEFSLPLMTRGTEFQKIIWQTLPGISYGKTISYMQLACQVGRPRASAQLGRQTAAIQFRSSSHVIV